MSIFNWCRHASVDKIVERIKSFHHFYTFETQGNLGGFWIYIFYVIKTCLLCWGWWLVNVIDRGKPSASCLLFLYLWTCENKTKGRQLYCYITLRCLTPLVDPLTYNGFAVGKHDLNPHRTCRSMSISNRYYILYLYSIIKGSKLGNNIIAFIIPLR